MGLIQTADQLRFSYQAIIQGAEAILNGDGLESFESQVCRYVNQCKMYLTLNKSFPDVLIK